MIISRRASAQISRRSHCRMTFPSMKRAIWMSGHGPPLPYGGTSCQIRVQWVLIFLRYSAPASNRSGSSLKIPSPRLQGLQSKPLTSPDAWSWSMTRRSPGFLPQTAQTPPWLWRRVSYSSVESRRFRTTGSLARSSNNDIASSKQRYKALLPALANRSTSRSQSSGLLFMVSDS